MEALQKQMKKADEAITKNNTNLRLMESKVKNCITQVNSLQKLSKGQTILFRQFKDHEIAIADNHYDAMDRIRQINEKAEAVEEQNKKRDAQIEDLTTLGNTVYDKEEKLEKAFSETKIKVNLDFQEFNAKINEQIQDF